MAGTVLNATLIAVWAWSRTLGIGSPAGPESIGVADGITILLEAGLIAMLAVFRSRRLASLSRIRALVPATSATVAIAGVAALATAIAIVDLGNGHGHGDVAGQPAGLIAASERSLAEGR